MNDLEEALDQFATDLANVPPVYFQAAAGAVGAAVLLWCIGWIRFLPCLECFVSCMRCGLVCVRVWCYCLPCCRRSDPDDHYEGSNLGAAVDLSPLPPGAAPPRPRGARPPPGWEDPISKPDVLKLEKSTSCGGLVDPEAPLCKLVNKLLGRQGVRVSWERALDFMAEEPSLFGEDGPTPMDLAQGDIGDCYFLSACAALAETPDMIRRLFAQQAVTEDGIYCISLMKNGSWHEVWVNDVFPTLDGKPVMCGSNDTHKLWPLLLEKAFAALYGNGDYLAIGDGGLPTFALHALSGCPTNQYDMRQHSREDLWRALQELGDGNAAACAFCMKKPFGPYVLPPRFRSALIDARERMARGRWTELLWVLGALTGQVLRNLCCLPILICRVLELVQEKCIGQAGCSGIVDGHAYSVLAAIEVEGSHGRERLVKLRNPWGEGEWRGRYSDGSWAWTEEAAEAADLEQADDGAFWMELSDFEAYYACTAICSLAPKAAKVDSGHLAGPVKPSAWHSSAFLLDLEACNVENGCWRYGCRLVVPTECVAVITADEYRAGPSTAAGSDSSQDEDDEDPEGADNIDGGSSGFTAHSWSLLVFERPEGDLVEKGCNRPGYRYLDDMWNARHDGGPFSETASLSTEAMRLQAGEYSVVLAFSSSTSEASLPKKVVCIVSASAPGAQLCAEGDGAATARYNDISIGEQRPLLQQMQR
eukprot:TRINITY_DN25684_c0_g1_i4.p1 TRINITY_DN25684_c0_g1~~TRINITY_DN25684_c0_g1_i4.p1  ORF type:complete len:704 (+),score=146.08 TRINITY_DN25684_c0_g1_i4:658-2769(+)